MKDVSRETIKLIEQREGSSKGGQYRHLQREPRADVRYYGPGWYIVRKDDETIVKGPFMGHGPGRAGDEELAREKLQSYENKDELKIQLLSGRGSRMEPATGGDPVEVAEQREGDVLDKIVKRALEFHETTGQLTWEDVGSVVDEFIREIIDEVSRRVVAKGLPEPD